MTEYRNGGGYRNDIRPAPAAPHDRFICDGEVANLTIDNELPGGIIPVDLDLRYLHLRGFQTYRVAG